MIMALTSSCIKPSDLNGLEEYATHELESNMLQFAEMELKVWWDEHYNLQSMIILAGAKSFSSTIELKPDLPEKDASPYELLNLLIKNYEIVHTLRSLEQQTGALLRDWSDICEDKQTPSRLGLRSKISRHYTRAIKLPKITEVYMAGGGTGEDGMSKFVESLTSTLGTLFNKDKADQIKKKAAKIKKLFKEKVPSDKKLFDLSRNACLKAVDDNKENYASFQNLHKEILQTSNKEWSNYLERKSTIGKILLDKKILALKGNNQEIERIIGISALNKLKANLAVMRSHLHQLMAKSRTSKSKDSQEELEDFFNSFSEQLELLTNSPNEELKALAESNLKFLHINMVGKK